MAVPKEVLFLAELQHGVFGAQQAAVEGLSRRAAGRLVQRGVLARMGSHVLRLAGHPQGIEQQWMAAVLEGGDGTNLSHRAGATLWRVPGFPRSYIEVARARGGPQRPCSFGHLHELRALDPALCTTVDGIPVTSLPLTLFHLAGLATPERDGMRAPRVERAVNSIVARSPSILPVLHATLPQLAESGRNGIVLMREILDRLPIGCVPPSSGAELQFETILREAGEPPLRRQVDVGGHAWVGRVDYLDDDVTLVCEVDSIAFHCSPLDAARDAQRDAALLAAGFRKVIRVWTEDVWTNRAKVLKTVRDARRELRERS